VGWLILAILAFVLKTTTKKIVIFFEKKNCTPEKILATPMRKPWSPKR